MKRAAFAAPIALLAAGCTATSSLEQVHAGMSREEVVAIMGPPQSSTHTAGRECAIYSVLKDFWSRVPWSMSARYYVCYTDGKVDYFGRADVPEVAGAPR